MDARRSDRIRISGRHQEERTTPRSSSVEPQVGGRGAAAPSVEREARTHAPGSSTLPISSYTERPIDIPPGSGYRASKAVRVPEHDRCRKPGTATWKAGRAQV